MLEVLGGLFLGSIASGLIPVINSELLVVGAAVLLPPGAALLVAIVAATGQMLAKLGLYGAARWAPAYLPERAKKKLATAGGKLQKNGAAVYLLLLVSASAGWPPFYGISLLAGALRINFAAFASLGLVGRFVRFGILAWGAQAVGQEALERVAVAWTGGVSSMLGG